MTELLMIDRTQILLCSADVLSEKGGAFFQRIREKWSERWEEWADQVWRRLEEREEIDVLAQDLEQIGWKLSEEYAQLYIAQFQVVESGRDWDSWPRRLKKFVFTNILREISGKSREGKILVCGGREDTYAVLFYRENDGRKNALTEETDIRQILEKTGKQVERFCGLRLAIYPGVWSGKQKLKENLRSLENRRVNNVRGESGIFETEGKEFCGRGKKEKRERIRSGIERWRLLLKKGYGAMALREMDAFLSERENLSGISDMVFFHQEYVKMILELLEDYHVETEKIFPPDSYSYRDFMEAYRSIDRMKEATRRSVEGLQAMRQKPEENLNDVERVKRMIQEHLDWNLSVGEIARELYVSREHLTRLFKREEGIGIKDFIIREKMAAAKELLADTQLSVGTIACRVGYENFSHFTQTFRQVEGMTPMEYRKVNAALKS